MKDTLTRERALHLFRQMWHWLTMHPDKEKRDWPRWRSNGGDIEFAKNHCFPCEWSTRQGKGCKDAGCLVLWPEEMGKNCFYPSVYHRWQRETDMRRRSYYARRIRDLPENPKFVEKCKCNLCGGTFESEPELNKHLDGTFHTPEVDDLRKARERQEEEGKRCMVHGCTNERKDGMFIGEMCSPCHEYITTGVVGPMDSFLKVLYEEHPEPVARERRRWRVWFRHDRGHYADVWTDTVLRPAHRVKFERESAKAAGEETAAISGYVLLE